MVLVLSKQSIPQKTCQKAEDYSRVDTYLQSQSLIWKAFTSSIASNLAKMAPQALHTQSFNSKSVHTTARSTLAVVKINSTEDSMTSHCKFNIPASKQVLFTENVS